MNKFSHLSTQNYTRLDWTRALAMVAVTYWGKVKGKVKGNWMYHVKGVGVVVA